MSYPAEIRTLIIEDDPDTVEDYRRIFGYLRERTLPLLGEPWFAESYDDAAAKLLRPDIYHVVILDLALPVETGAPLGDDVARGLGLIPSIAAREDYPVPILMIVTADPKRILNAPAVEQQLRSEFWEHFVISKNPELATQLVPGFEAAIRYSSVGIHIVGDETGGELWPMLSPREEDILRRAILQSGASATGADLRWWSAERKNLRSSKRSWSKVLHGKFVLGGQAGCSRERFFKFVSKEEGETTRRSAELLASKLPHGQLIKYVAIGSRALLVTEKAGRNDSLVRSLRSVLKPGEPICDADLETIAADVVDELNMLGDATGTTSIIRRILWAHHDGDRLLSGWRRIHCDGGVDPVSVLHDLRARTERLVGSRQMCHGDLHPGNVSVAEDGGRLRAYIIDAGSMTSDLFGKDIAALEVSILLHITFDADVTPLTAVPSLFDGSDPYGERIDWLGVPTAITNAVRLIVNLRKRVRDKCSEAIYVVLLLDHVLIQIGGVAFGTSYNKITSLADVGSLFERLVVWYRRQFPEIAT